MHDVYVLDVSQVSCRYRWPSVCVAWIEFSANYFWRGNVFLLSSAIIWTAAFLHKNTSTSSSSSFIPFFNISKSRNWQNNLKYRIYQYFSFTVRCLVFEFTLFIYIYEGGWGWSTWIRWPLRLKHGIPGFELTKEDMIPFDITRIWAAMEEISRLGLAKSIGVSNFGILKLSQILHNATIPPAVNQVEMNPSWQQGKLRDFCKERNSCDCVVSLGTLWISSA